MRPAVLLPGTLCDGRVFGTLPDRLARPAILDPSSFSDARTAARDLIEQVEPGSLGIAFSLGGWVLLEMVRLDPMRFAGVVLLSGNTHPDAPQNAQGRRDRVVFARARGFGALFSGEWPAMLGEGHRDDPVIRATILAMADAAGHDSHARQAEMNITRPDHRILASDPPVPIHVFAGAEDALCPPDRYETAASGPASSLTVVDGAGHYLPLEAPEALASALKPCFPEYFA